MIDLHERRKWWNERFVTPPAGGVLQVSPVGVRFCCPCCGYPTLEESAAYEICGLCSWEDDGQDDPNANEIYGGPNGDYSLSEARANYACDLTQYRKSDLESNSMRRQTGREINAKQSYINAYHALMEEDDGAAQAGSWREMSEAESILLGENIRKVRDYEKGNEDSDDETHS